MPSHVSSIWPSGSRDSLEVHSLGIVDYPSILGLQNRIAYEIGGRNDRLGTVLLYESPPVISVGREGSYADFRINQEELAARMIDVHWISRGGSNQVHAPGQLSASILLPLDRLKLGLLEYRQIIESVGKSVAEDMKVPCSVHQSRLIARTGQIGAIGLLVKSGVSHYGLTINVQPNLDLIRLCETGGTETRHSSLAADRMKFTPMNSVRESLVRHLTDQLNYEQLHWYTGHPLLTRTKKKVHVFS